MISTRRSFACAVTEGVCPSRGGVERSRSSLAQAPTRLSWWGELISVASAFSAPRVLAVLLLVGLGPAFAAEQPTSVTDLSVDPGDGRLAVHWTAATHAPHGYIVRWREQRFDSSLTEGESASSGHVITGLENGRSYIVRVDTVGSDGRAVRRTGVSVRGTPVADAASLPVGSLSVEPGDGRLTVSWVVPSSAAHGHLLRWRERAPGSRLTTVSDATSGHVVTGLENGRTYIVRVDTLDAKGQVVPGTNVASLGAPVADVRELVLSRDALTVDEGGSATYTVALSSRPSGPVTVAVAVGSGDVSVEPATLSFGPADWSNGRTVTVKAASDADGIDDSSTLVHTASGGGYETVVAHVAATVADDETAALVLSSTSLVVAEGGAGTYKVALATQPSAGVTVRIDGASGGVTVEPASLAFTVGDWATERTVTVSAARDADGADDSVILTHTASGGDYGAGAVTGQVVVTVSDDDVLGLVFAPSTVRVLEGGGTVYRVSLATLPTGSVRVLLGSTRGTDLSVTPSELGFTAANWDGGRTVKISAAHDADSVDDVVTLTHETSGGGYESLTGRLSVTVVDDDQPGLVLSAASVTVSEGASAAYTVSLTVRPSADVTVSVGGASGDVSVQPATLTFTTGDWDTKQTVTVSATQDTDAVDDTLTLSHSASGGGYDGVVADGLSVTVADDEVAALVLSAASLTVAEGTSATYTVALATQPSAPVTVAVGGASDGVTVKPSTLTFTADRWRTGQTVTVAVAQDDDATDGSVALMHTASGGDYGSESVTGTVAVTVTDEDTPALVLSSTALTVDEGASATYTVRLATRPTEAVTVALSGASGGVTVVPASLSFSTSAWSTAQTVTVRAASDDDASDGSVTLTHAASGGDYGSESVAGTVSVTVTDDDTPALVLSATSVTVDEGGSSTYTVRLATQPTGAVTVALSGASGGVTVEPASLSFSTSAWSTTQTVTVRAASDDDTSDGSATLAHVASGGDYGSKSVSAEVAITVADDDAPALVLSATSITVDEGGSAAYTVRLATQPTEAVTVALSGASGGVTVEPASLSFSTSAWSTTQTVTVRAVSDDDASDGSVTLTHAASGGDYGSKSVSAEVAVTVTDDDTPALVLSATSITVDEGGSAAYTVRLATQPTEAVTVALSGASGGVTVEPASLSFSTSAWSAAQTVTVRAASDDDASDGSATLTHVASGGDYGSKSVSAEVAVTVTDDDTPALVLSATSITVDEGGSATYTVRLATRPTEAVTVALAGASGGVTVEPASLSFSTSAWGTAQTVTVRAASDDDASDGSASFTHTASGGDYGPSSVTGTVSVTVTDDDTPALVLSSTALTVDEGASATYTVRLATQPTEAVTVALSGASGGVSVQPASLSFSASAWSTAQTVTVRAASDDDASDGSATLTHAASGGDYGSRSVSAEVAVTVADDDTPALVFSSTVLTVGEEASATYTVRLATRPTGAVTVALSGASGGVSVQPASLSFSTSAWSTAQTVTVRAASDDDGIDGSASLMHTASGGDYGTPSVTGTVSVTVADDDTPALVLSSTALTVGEGASATYTVRLATRPLEAVTVALSGTSGGVTVEPASLSFSTSAWSTTQTVTVRAASDDDASDGSATLTHTASGGDYGSKSVSAEVAVMVTDDDTPALVLSATSITVDEGGSAAYTVRLATQPTEAVTVALSGTSGGVTVEPASLSFSTSAWSTVQTVTVRAASDDDASDGSATLTHAASGGDYGSKSVSAEVSVTVTDEDVPALVLSATSITVDEGGSAAYTVRLATQPTEAVTVALSGASGGVSVQPASLSFSTSAWSTAQTVTVRAVSDDDASDGSATLTHAASGGDYGSESVTGTVAVTVTDDDTPALVLSATSITVDEGGSAAYTVRLATRPTEAVTVALAGASGGVTVEPASLSFSTVAWSTAQTVTVRAASDDDGIDGSASLAHTASGGDYGTPSVTGTVSVTVADDDTPALVLSLASLTVAEGGIGTYTVALATQPSAAVTVALSVGSGDVTVSPVSLDFSVGAWNVAQTVTVSVGSDDDALDDSVLLTHAASGGDYGLRSVAGQVSVTVTDDDTSALVLSSASLTVAEGASGTYTVALATQPSAAVTVALAASSGDVTVSPASLTFGVDAWSVAQVVTVGGASDDDASDGSATLTHTASGGDYGSESVTGTVSVAVTDDDTPALVLSSAALTVDEGGECDLYGPPCDAADRGRDGRSLGGVGGCVRRARFVELLDQCVEHGPDGDGARGIGRRCVGWLGDADACCFGWRLWFRVRDGDGRGDGGR